MTPADDSELGMNIVFPQTSRKTLKRNVPSIRLADKADLRKIYKFGRKLGEGSFGVVYEATHTETQTKWAIKEVYRPAPGSSKIKMLEHEINILEQVNHAHIIQLHEVYNTPKMTYLVTELCFGGELKQLLQQEKFFSEDETRHIIRSLTDAVVYLHKRDIVHRDLKLENILVKDPFPGRINIKVIDFGLSVQTGGVGIENMMTEACGTLHYMGMTPVSPTADDHRDGALAPEVMSGRSYSWLCDVWSIGVIMYMLLCGEPPFVSNTKAELLEEIKHKEVKFTQPIWATVSDAAKNVLTCLLKVDPAYRMSANQFLENPWITGDTNMPVIPSNVLEMMRQHHQARVQGLEDSLDPTLVLGTASTETTGTVRKHPPERESTCTSCAKKSGGCRKQKNCKNGFGKLGPPQPSTTQAHAYVKPVTQPSTEQRRPQDKRDFSTGQKPASDINKTGYLRPTIATKNKNVSPKTTSRF